MSTRIALRLLFVAATVFAASALVARPAAAQALVADISDHLVAITAGFTGTNVVVFGAVDGEGDVAIVVKGPERDVTVRHKGRIAGIWVNENELQFVGVPLFYLVASSRPLGELAPPDVLKRHDIGLENMRLAAKRAVPKEENQEFREGLIRNKLRQKLYFTEPFKVSFLTGRLFRSDFYIPANVPIGTYSVEVYFIRDSQVVGAQTIPFIVSNAGVGADIQYFAHVHSILYGIIAIFLALAAGWGASVAFRRI
ncbi:MAG: TIGR02186 family protein [Alphaproteobacteria bacterium]